MANLLGRRREVGQGRDAVGLGPRHELPVSPIPPALPVRLGL